jgi:hypothetical protein
MKRLIPSVALALALLPPAGAGAAPAGKPAAPPAATG